MVQTLGGGPRLVGRGHGSHFLACLDLDLEKHSDLNQCCCMCYPAGLTFKSIVSFDGIT
jgi:hypothetical protein